MALMQTSEVEEMLTPLDAMYTDFYGVILLIGQEGGFDWSHVARETSCCPF
jgi:hypothetical protein